MGADAVASVLAVAGSVVVAASGSSSAEVGSTPAAWSWLAKDVGAVVVLEPVVATDGAKIWAASGEIDAMRCSIVWIELVASAIVTADPAALGTPRRARLHDVLQQRLFLAPERLAMLLAPLLLETLERLELLARLGEPLAGVDDERALALTRRVGALEVQQRRASLAIGLHERRCGARCCAQPRVGTRERLRAGGERPLGSGVGGHAPAELGLGLALDVRAHALDGFEWEGESLHGRP